VGTKTFLHPLLSLGNRAPRFLLLNDRTGRVVASALELAGDSRSRRIGLLGRHVLSPGHALIIAPSNGIHTFGMQFTIDVVFVTRQGKVTKVRQALPPSRLCLGWPSYAVIELPSGGLQSSGTRAGDVLSIVSVAAVMEDTSASSGHVQNSV
jgi:uncharacterized protein